MACTVVKLVTTVLSVFVFVLGCMCVCTCVHACVFKTACGRRFDWPGLLGRAVSSTFRMFPVCRIQRFKFEVTKYVCISSESFEEFE